jgi:iron complex transport system ATP-binding protein
MTLELRNAQARAGSKLLVAGATAVLRPGRFTAVVGPNGAGKSTLLTMLSGQRRPDAGEVLLDGEPVASIGNEALARRRAVMPQDSQVAFDFTAEEVCALGRYPHRLRPSAREAQIVPEALAAVGMQSMGDRSFATLSGGEKARVHLARALAQIWEPAEGGKARWLLLDEPTAALDLHHQHQVMRLANRLVAQTGMGIVAVLHDVNLALRYADDVLLLSAGQAAQFGPAVSVLTPQRIAEVWQVECQVTQDRAGQRHLVFG